MTQITLTGVDIYTPLDAVKELVDLGAEIGVLITATPEGRNRYPDLVCIRRVVERFQNRVSLHICGSKARKWLINDELTWLVSQTGRLQINGGVGVAELVKICGMFPKQEIITQDTLGNAGLLRIELSNHAILVDSSGGRGILPAVWDRPETAKSVGFAGGLGPTTMRESLPRIQLVAKEPWWIDMESSLRDEQDRFDVDRAKQVLGIWEHCYGRQEEKS